MTKMNKNDIWWIWHLNVNIKDNIEEDNTFLMNWTKAIMTMIIELIQKWHYDIKNTKWT